MQDVKVSIQKIAIPTYLNAEYEKLPLFAETRVHQRSSGNPYPNPVVNTMRRDTLTEKMYESIVLENEYLRLVILPELGGRIFSARDKTNGYDFFYQQHVIKPALIGMLGLWISGGVEFNWPAHHRPSTYLPVDYSVQRHADGAVTVWLSEHEPLDRMKGMVGIFLAPGRAGFETRMRVYNRTELPRSFLWWENAAVPVNTDYEIFFPPDVTYVNFHYKKATGAFPIMDDYFNTQDNRGGNDIRLHRNTKSATSYFCGASSFDFFGGYDHGKKAGVVHFADHATSVGKKMFTWGYRRLSKAWEKALTDSDGAYAELMASSYSDNQPDFTWLEAGEIKEFSQSWYPIKDIGPVKNANADLAIAYGEGKVGIYPVASLKARLIIRKLGNTIFSSSIDLHAAEPYTAAVPGFDDDCAISVENPDGSILLAYVPKKYDTVVPTPKVDNPLPDALKTADACWLCGRHLAQYRDPIADPGVYWEHGLELDPDHAPCLTSLGAQRIDRFQYEEAIGYLSRAIESICRYNPNPRDSEAFVLLGIALKKVRRFDEAYEVLSKALWSKSSIASAGLILAQIDCALGRFSLAERRLRELERLSGFSQKGACLRAACLRRQGRKIEAAEAAGSVLAQDPMDYFAWNELQLAEGAAIDTIPVFRSDPRQAALDLACDYADAGLYDEAVDVLSRLEMDSPSTAYLRAYLAGDPALYRKAETLDPAYCFPSRGWEKAALEDAVRKNADDSQAHLLLGDLLYGRCRRYEDAASHWSLAGEGVQAKRNLAIARFRMNSKDPIVPELLTTALESDPTNLQLLYERNLALELQGEDAKKRFLIWNSAGKLAARRDDLFLQGVHAANQASEWRCALTLLKDHEFIPCEGGEHAVSEEYLFANFALGLSAMLAQDFPGALAFFKANRELPENLGGGVWHDVMLSPYRYLEGVCFSALGESDKASECFASVVSFPVNYFTTMYLPTYRFWRGMALRRIGRAEEGNAQIASLLADAEKGLAQKDFGWFAQTPFFNCFWESSEKARFKFFGLLKAYALLAENKAESALALLDQLLKADPGFMQAGAVHDYWRELML